MKLEIKCHHELRIARFFLITQEVLKNTISMYRL